MTKLVGSFLIVAAIGAIIGGLGIFHMGRISAATESLYGRECRCSRACRKPTSTCSTPAARR